MGEHLRKRDLLRHRVVLTSLMALAVGAVLCWDLRNASALASEVSERTDYCLQNVYLAEQGRPSYLGADLTKLWPSCDQHAKWRLTPLGDATYSIQNVDLLRQGLPCYLSDALPKLWNARGQGEVWRVVSVADDTYAIQNVYLQEQGKGSFLSDALPELWKGQGKGEVWRLVPAT